MALVYYMLYYLTVSVALLHMNMGFWQKYGPRWIVRQGGSQTDPTVQGLDYTAIKSRFEREGWLNNKRIFTGTPRWWLTGKVDWALKGRLPVIVFDTDPRNLALLINPQTLKGYDAVIIGQGHQESVDINVKPFFDSVIAMPDIVIYRNGIDELHLQVYYCKNFRLCKQAYDNLPLYRQLTGRPAF